MTNIKRTIFFFVITFHIIFLSLLNVKVYAEDPKILRTDYCDIYYSNENVLNDAQPDLSPEIYQLKELQHRITDDGVPSELRPLEKLEIELQMALLSENYEQAATLRDQIAKSSK